MTADDRDRGAVAVVVALVVTLVLIPVGALALDLGNSYTVAAALQRTADAAATAGAQELARQQRANASQSAAIAAARTVAVDVLCKDGALGTTWASQCSSRGWASDGDTDPADSTRRPNGEVEFYGGPPSATHTFAPSQRIGGTTGALVTGIRVVTPVATVRYGLATIFGRSSGSLQRSATAELRTVLPARDWNGRSGANLPLYLTNADLPPPLGNHGAVGYCARSAPRKSWEIATGVESQSPDGPACTPQNTPSVPRGYLADSATRPLTIGTTVSPVSQRWTDVARLRALTPTLVGSGGRLTLSGCKGGNGATSGGYGGLEAAHLADFLTARSPGTAQAKSFILSEAPATAAQEGWLSPDILQCGRLALLPVLGTVTAPPDPLGLTTRPYPITDLRLVWLDNEFTGSEQNSSRIAYTADNANCLQRGLYWENAYTSGVCPGRDEDNAPLRAITGYILDPRLLPAVVPSTTAANTSAYLGSGLPATVRLVRDLSDPPAT